jgi:hypothetical protein
MKAFSKGSPDERRNAHHIIHAGDQRGRTCAPVERGKLRLTAVADGINLELSKRRTNPTPTITPPVRQIDRGDLER